MGHKQTAFFQGRGKRSHPRMPPPPSLKNRKAAGKGKGENPVGARIIKKKSGNRSGLGAGIPEVGSPVLGGGGFSRGSKDDGSSRPSYVRTVILRSALCARLEGWATTNRHPSRLAKTLAPQDDGTSFPK